MPLVGYCVVHPFWNNFTCMKTPKQRQKKRSIRSASFRFTDDQLNALKQAAKEDGRSLQKFMTHKVVPNAKRLVGDNPSIAA